MTTPAQISAQIVDLMTRWNSQQDQMAGWLTGDPAGGPNGDGKYPLTNAQGETQLFLSLPAIINQVAGPAANAVTARNAAQAAATLAQAAQAAAEAAKLAAQGAQSETTSLRSLVSTQQADVAAKWSDVNAWYTNITASVALTDFNAGLIEGIYDETETNLVIAEGVYNQLRADAETARDEAVTARNQAQTFAASINPASFAAASHTHTIAQITGLQSALDAKQGSLGFTPIQQGGGNGQLTNNLYIGWDGSALRLQVDNTSFGATWPIDISGSAPWANITGRPTTFTPSAHSHVIADVIGLQSALDGRLLTSGGTVSGNLAVTGTSFLVGTAPTQWWTDTDNRTFAIHVNSDVAYFMRGGVNDNNWTALPNGAWPLQMDLNNGTLAPGGLLLCRNSEGTDVNTANDTGSISVRGTSTSIASISFHRTGAYAMNMGLGTDNVFRIGGWSAVADAFRLDGSGNLNISGSIRDAGGRVLSHADSARGGGKVTISTAAPSGGSDGDVWLRVT